MKVLHVSPSIARRDGGPSEVIRQLLPALTKAGVGVTLATTDKGANAEDTRFMREVSAIVGSSKKHPRGMNFATHLRVPLLRAIRDADIVHVHGVNTYVSSLAVQLARKTQTPILLQPHGTYTKYQREHASRLRRIYASSVDRNLENRVQGLLVSSALEKSELSTYATQKVFEIPLGVDLNLAAVAREPNAEEPFVLFLGRVTSKKRLDLVLRAIPLLTATNVGLKVAGPTSPDLSWSPEALTQELGIQDRVEFLGQVDAVKRTELLASALAFVLPSDDESFGISAAESMAAGCPTIVSSRVGIASPGVISLRPSPVIVAPQTPAGIASCLQRVIDDSTFAAETSRASRSYANDNFNWDAISVALVKAYETLDTA